MPSTSINTSGQNQTAVTRKSAGRDGEVEYTEEQRELKVLKKYNEQESIIKKSIS